MMRKYSAGLFSLFFAFAAIGIAQAQEKVKINDYEFSPVKQLKVNPVQNQNRTGTCWSFSTLSFIESELYRMGKGEHYLSEMFVVRNTYADKAKRYVRYHGHLNFAAGGAFHDVTYVMKNYGAVPEAVYNGLSYGFDSHNHGELDAVTKAYVDAVIANRSRKNLSDSWEKGLDGILDAYLGDYPAEFEFKGKKYTPKSYAASLGVNPDDYVEIASFTHHPFYEKFVIELPDNWLGGEVYNVPLADLKAIMHNAVDNGYSIAWAADVSEKGFSHRNGVAVAPKGGWEGLKRSEIDSMLKKPLEQENVTQEMRQKQFDNYATTDDHGMHITGKAKDQNGNVYFIVKNSWGDDSNKCGGYLYASEAYTWLKTIDVMVHKDAIPKSIKKKLGIK